MLVCIACGQRYGLERRHLQCDCGGLLDVWLDLAPLRGRVTHVTFDQRLGATTLPHCSGVWRYRELLFPVRDEAIVSRPEGNTNLYRSARLGRWVGLDDLQLKHEGENPTGSFKDRGMTTGTTHAKILGARYVVCASTGNTAASMASYAALSGLRALLLIPAGAISYGKLSQALAYGARTVQVDGDFDAAMALVRALSQRDDIYVLNSLNPFRVEGQKSIAFELLQQRGWQPPDWIVVPGGNLANGAAIGKALYELREIGLLVRLPRLAVIQAAGANPLYRAYKADFRHFEPVHAATIASAIRIGRPVSYERAVRALRWTDGVVEQVSDAEIMDAKAQVDAAGIGCEPASAAAVAGVRRLVAAGVIRRGESAVAILTGHLLKDPDATLSYHLDRLPDLRPAHANPPVTIAPDPAALERLLATEATAHAG
ncbi:MAG: threonine synthase [Chloroflexi bacterium]|nr:threonine synthase [Chloroflexota bacterium]